MFRIFLNINRSISYSFRSIANQNGVRYSDSTSYFKKYSSSKCKQTVCLHYGLDFHFKFALNTTRKIACTDVNVKLIKKADQSILLTRVFCLHFLFETIDNLIKIPIYGPIDRNFNSIIYCLKHKM